MLVKLPFMEFLNGFSTADDMERCDAKNAKSFRLNNLFVLGHFMTLNFHLFDHIQVMFTLFT